jgi:eukaryotic-like serine/threonine-protein kinase
VEFDAALAILSLAVSPSDQGRSPLAPRRVGRYELTGPCIGHGGTGEVYPATDPVSGGRLAIKIAWSDLPSVAAILADEWHKALLNHEHILVAHDRGVHEGRSYLVFRRLEGHLTDELRRERYSTPDSIVELMLKLVEAVAFAHGRAVLHCDLKPSNILFDEKQRPHVADFGLARTIQASGSSGKAWGGTRGWMSPEQVAQEPLGVESDVFTLGVILYWLLAGGSLPFGRGDDYEQRVLHEAPEPLPAPGRFARTLTCDLAAICRRALQKEPLERYRSAADLWSDLERAKNKRLPVAVDGGFRNGRRVARWARGHWAAGPLLLALALLPSAFTVQNDVLREVRSTLRPQNRFSAVAQANAVKSELYGMALRVHAMALDPKILGLLQHGGIHLEAPALEAHAVEFDSVNVFSADGTHHARWPVGPKGEEINVSDKDHFACARKIADALLSRPRSDASATLPVCVARAHRSRLDKRVKLGMAAPVIVSGRLVGVVEGSTMARDRFGAVQMSCGPGDCLTALLGPRDREEPGDPLPAALSILAQHRLGVGKEQGLPVELSDRICARIGCNPDPLRPFEQNRAEPLELEHYRDPVTGGSSVAVVAPVAQTGLSVLIAMPDSATYEKLADIARAALHRWWVPLLVAAVAWLALFSASIPRWPWPAKTARRRK